MTQFSNIKGSATHPFGDPSDKILVTGNISNLIVFILGQHGSDHDKNSSNINLSKMNSYCLGFERTWMYTHIIETDAVGSLNRKYAPGQLFMCDQFIDQTRGRKKTHCI